MIEDYQILVDGSDVTALVTAAVFTDANAAGNSLALTFARALDTAAFDDFAVVVLKRKVAEVWTTLWTGTLLTEPAHGSGVEESVQLTARGLWWRWENIIFQQEIQIGASDDPSYVPSPTFMLGRIYDEETDEATRISAQAQFVRLTDFLTANGLTFTVDGELSALELPWIPRSNSSVASLIQTLLTWLPAYTITQPGGVNVLVRDIDAEDVPVRELSELDLDIEDVTINPRYDLLLNSTKIIWHSRSRDSQGREYITSVTEDLDSTGGLSSPVDLVYPVELEVGETPPAAGLAAEYQRWRGRLHLDSQIRKVGDLKWDWQPGDMVEFSGVLDRYQTATAVLQVITRDLFTDTLTLDVGPRNHLGLDQLIQLARKPPKEQRDPPGASTAPTGSLVIQLSVPGSPDDLDKADCFWTAVGPETRQGNGEDTIEVQQGDYAVTFHPVFRIADGRVFWPEVTVVQASVGIGGDTVTGSYNSVQRWQIKSSTQEDPTGFDLDAQTLIDAGLPEGKALAKAREYYVTVNGTVQKAFFLTTEPYEPE